MTAFIHSSNHSTVWCTQEMFYASRNGRELDCHWNPKRWFEFYNKIKWKDVASAARAATATVSEINKVMELNGETQRRPFGYKTQRLLLHQAKMSHSQIPSVARSNMCSTNRRAGGRWTLNVISESVFETEHWVNTSSRWAAGLHFKCWWIIWSFQAYQTCLDEFV